MSTLKNSERFCDPPVRLIRVINRMLEDEFQPQIDVEPKELRRRQVQFRGIIADLLAAPYSPSYKNLLVEFQNAANNPDYEPDFQSFARAVALQIKELKRHRSPSSKRKAIKK